MKYTVVTWDWKEQPDWVQINFGLVEHPLSICHPVHTGSDQFAVVICNADEVNPQTAYEEWFKKRCES